MKNLLLILTIFSLSLSSCKKEKDMNNSIRVWELREKLQHNSDGSEQTLFPTPSRWDISKTETCITQNSTTSCYVSSWVETNFTINGSSWNGSFEVVQHEENVSLWLKKDTGTDSWVILKFISVVIQ